MDLDQPPDDVEAHSGAVDLTGRRPVPLGERLEELADRGRVEVGTGVADPQYHLIADPTRDEPDGRSGPGVHQRVVDQVGDHLVQRLAGHAHRQLGRQVDADVRRGGR